MHAHQHVISHSKNEWSETTLLAQDKYWTMVIIIIIIIITTITITIVTAMTMCLWCCHDGKAITKSSPSSFDEYRTPLSSC